MEFANALPPFARSDSLWSVITLDATALPPASRQREIEKLAINNLSNGYPLFVHYVQPTLELRRSELLDSGTTKKKFYKKIGQLWHDLPQHQKAFWNGEAAQLRVSIKQNLMTHEECLRYVGSPDQWDTYIHHAETAVAEYLRVPPRSTLPSEAASEMEGDKRESMPTAMTSKSEMANEAEPQFADLQPCDQPLLDTLPDRFTVEPRMLYGHFARYDLDEILTTPTRKRQLEKLRRLADLFDQTGKVLFYYYVYPRLWKRMRPLDVDESIATAAQYFWHYAEGTITEQWSMAEVGVKKMLGDGDLRGLSLLRLDSMDTEVLRFHEMAEEAVSGR